MIDPQAIPLAQVAWTAARRIIRSLYPPIDLFEDVADPADWPLLLSAEQKTNPRLMATIGREDLGNDPDLASNTGRVKRVEELDAAIGAWTKTRTVDEVLQALDVASVPAGRIYTVADIAADPHYAARGMLQQVRLDDGETLTVPGIIPKLSRTPGSHQRNAPRLGQDSEAVMRELGLTEEQIAGLKSRGVIKGEA